MDSSKLKTIISAAFAALAALYLGIAAATAQIEAVAWIVVTVFLSICFLLGRHVWILIPATLSMKGGINLLPGQIPVWALMTVTVGGFYALRVAMRQQNITFRWSWMETALVLVGITILQALARNPVGLRALGGDTAGGKPYIIFALGFAAYYLIANSNASLKSWKWAVILYIAFGILDGLINAASGFSPAFASAMVRIYSNVSFNSAFEGGANTDVFETRLGFLTQIGGLLGLIACSFWRPLGAIDFTKPWRALTAGLAVFCILLGGFRGAMAGLLVRFCLGSAIRRHYLDILLILLIGTMGIAILAASGLSRSLPFGGQRILTAIPIPMDLDPVAKMQADHSSESRFNMWKLALTTDRYIDSKLLGDGFQLNATEVEVMAGLKAGDSRFKNLGFEERALAMGDYHGFHVETIRNTGAVGLFAATFALIAFAAHAWKAIQHFRGDPMWGYVIFICMPVVIMPFWYWFVFGSYKAAFPDVVAMAGMVKLAWLFGRERGFAGMPVRSAAAAASPQRRAYRPAHPLAQAKTF